MNTMVMFMWSAHVECSRCSYNGHTQGGGAIMVCAHMLLWGHDAYDLVLCGAVQAVL